MVKPQSNDLQDVDLEDGRLMLNMRNTNGSGLRAVAISDGGGIIWSKVYENTILIDSVCQGTIVRFPFKESNTE